MKKFSLVIPGLCILATAVAAVMLCIDTPPGTDTPSDPSSAAEPNVIEKPTVTPASVERVKSRVMKGEFVTTGCGEDAKWGVAQTLNFQYKVDVIAESEILSKESLPSGYIKVEERRTFRSVSDSLCVSDVDLELNLKTIPLGTFSKAIDAIAGVYSGLTQDVVTGGLISQQNHYWTTALKAVDGISLRTILGYTDIQIPKDVESMVEAFGNARIRKALGGVREISGKSYLVTWYQEESGLPMYAKFTYEDGTPVSNEEELLVLRRVNTFIDSHIAPNPDCKQGDSWDVPVDCLQEVFDPYVEGTYTGTAKFVRGNDDENGLWTMSLQPGKVDVVDEQGRTTGRIVVSEGYAKISPSDVCLQELFVKGKGKLQKLTKHHWLFTAKVAGECDFQGRIISIDVKDDDSASVAE